MKAEFINSVKLKGLWMGLLLLLVQLPLAAFTDAVMSIVANFTELRQPTVVAVVVYIYASGKCVRVCM